MTSKILFILLLFVVIGRQRIARRFNIKIHRLGFLDRMKPFLIVQHS